MPSAEDFVCIGWNARGVALGQMGVTFEILESEFHWGILLIQEFSNASVPEEVAGHLLLCEPSNGGRNRRTCVVVHRDYRASVLGDPILHTRAVGVCLRSPVGGKLC